MSDEVFQFPDSERRRSMLRYSLRKRLNERRGIDADVSPMPSKRLSQGQFGQVINVDFKNKNKK
jgi:hypothetical protein